MSKLASQPQSLTPFFVFAHWNLGKYADAGGFFADKVDRGQKSGFFLASSALGYKHWDRGEKRSIHPERNSTHLGIWVVRINTCIGLIIKDSLNEDRCYPLKARWFHKPDLNSDVVVITVRVPHWPGDKSPYHYYISSDNSRLFCLLCYSFSIFAVKEA